MFPLPPVLSIAVIFCLCVGPKGRELKTVVDYPKGKLAVALREGEEGLIHILERREKEPDRKKKETA